MLSPEAYKVSAKISSIDVAKKIALSFYDKDGNLLDIVNSANIVTDTYITSAKDYAHASYADIACPLHSKQTLRHRNRHKLYATCF